MDFMDAVRLTAASMRTHKTRGALSALGVVLGIAAVIGLVTVGAGVSESITGNIGGQFDATILILGAQPAGGGFGPGGGGPGGSLVVRAYTDRDVAELSRLPDAKDISASVELAGAEVRLAGDLVQGLRVLARDGAYAPALDAGVLPKGPSEALASNATAEAFRVLTRGGTVVGRIVQLHTAEGRTADVRIVGVEKAGGIFGAGATISVAADYVPSSTVDGQATRLWERVTIHAPAPDRVAALKQQAKAYLDGPSDAKDVLGERYKVSYQTQEDVANLISTTIGQFTLFIAAIGAVSLVVGLVGIANIMLVSVSERTREIGVMKATGAKRSEIILVFLVEAVAICLVGAVLGVVAGSLIGYGLGQAIARLSANGAPVPFVFLGQWYAIAVGLGILTGLAAGLYPAWRAAKVSPVEALRYE